jgi:hypothetical protein
MLCCCVNTHTHWQRTRSVHLYTSCHVWLAPRCPLKMHAHSTGRNAVWNMRASGRCRMHGSKVYSQQRSTPHSC